MRVSLPQLSVWRKQLIEKVPRICTISIQNEILRSDKTRVLFHSFPISFFLLFIKNTIDTKKCNVQQRLFVNYLYMCIILFLMIIILSFQSHQIRMLSAGSGMAWNRYGLSWNDIRALLQRGVIHCDQWVTFGSDLLRSFCTKEVHTFP